MLAYLPSRGWNAAMDLNKVIHDLHEEKKKLDRVIASLEELQRIGASLDMVQGVKRRGRKSMDAKARQEVSQRMKKYWAMRRKLNNIGQ